MIRAQLVWPIHPGGRCKPLHTGIKNHGFRKQFNPAWGGICWPGGQHAIGQRAEYGQRGPHPGFVKFGVATICSKIAICEHIGVRTPYRDKILHEGGCAILQRIWRPLLFKGFRHANQAVCGIIRQRKHQSAHIGKIDIKTGRCGPGRARYRYRRQVQRRAGLEHGAGGLHQTGLGRGAFSARLRPAFAAVILHAEL